MKTQFTTHARVVLVPGQSDRYEILLDNGTVIVGFGIEDGMTREECRKLLEEIERRRQEKLAALN